METKYTTENAIQLIREIEPILSQSGIHTSLTGSTLYKGNSTKDFDIFLYPHNPKDKLTIEFVRSILKKIGFVHIKPTGGSGKYNGRTVDVMKYKDYRVDFFLDTFKK